MSAINGTSILLYSDGQPIAMQKGLTVGWDVDLPDATNKGSAGWAEHIIGLMNAKIDFNALYSTGLMTDNPKVLSAKDLMDYILNSTSLLVAILGGPFPIVGKADLSSLSFDAPMEAAMTLSGSLKINGALYPLTGTLTNLITNPSASVQEYDTLTVSGTAITSAVNASGTVRCGSNVFNVTIGETLKLMFYLNNAVNLPRLVLIEAGTANEVTNNVLPVAGLNMITLTVTSTVSAYLKFYNTSAANWNTSPIYLFRP